MSEPITVTVRELRGASEAMFLWLERNVGDQIALDVDLFWWIDPKQMYNPYRAPDDLALGSVADSIQYLRDCGGRGTDPGWTRVAVSSDTCSA